MESSLNLQYKQLVAETGEFLGAGRGADFGDPAYTTQAKQDIDFSVASGLRQFYFPSSVDGGPNSYDWSFLKPTFTLAFASAAKTVALPDDFGGMEGQLSLVTTTTTSMPWCIQWQNEGRIQQCYATQPTNTGPPMFAVVQPLKGTGGDRGQRWQLYLFPAADQAYTLTGQYYVNPDFLSGAFPYAYGGAEHAETLLESCLAIAEQRRDDAMSVHTMKFKERLQASISMDRRKKPPRVGYNGDRSDQIDYGRVNPHAWAAAGTYNGIAFT